jgi:hypothetical protein
MDDGDAGMLNVALGVVAAAVALTLGIVLAVAIGATGRAPESALATPAAETETIAFAPGDDVLSVQAAERLAQIAAALRNQDAEAVVITPRYSVAAGIAAAMRRGLVVQHALEADGAPAGSVVVNPPARHPGSDGVGVVLR